MKVIMLASWKMMALPKAFGAWGPKNPFLFSKVPSAKNVWRLIQGIGLRAHLVIDKYIEFNIVEDWIRSCIKQ
jgi:hypothetical protein